MLLLALPMLAHGHGGGTGNALPEHSGLLATLTLAGAYLESGKTLPSQALPGFLREGDPGDDIAGLTLEHATLDLGYRFNEHIGAQLAFGRHDGSSIETQVARIEFANTDSRANTWKLSIGRQRPELGAVMTGAGHFDRFGLVPLVKRATVNDDWVDDGLQLGWQRTLGATTLAANAGLWRGEVFPGSRDSGSVVPALHVSAIRGGLTLDTFYAAFKPEGRGASIANAPGGHTHARPRCDPALTEVICFDGDTHLAGFSALWQAPTLPLSLTLATWLRMDDGELYSRNGTVDYQGDTKGGWAEARWQLRPTVDAGIRLERLEATHKLDGGGASMLVNEAGFADYDPANRVSAMVGYQLHPSVLVRLEAGSESAGGERSGYGLLRVILSGSKQLAGEH